MKNIIIVAMLFVFVGCQTQEQKTKVKFNNYIVEHIEFTNWDEVFKELEKSSGLKFQLVMSKEYRTKELPPIDIKFENLTLKELLDNIKLGGGPSYEIKGNTIIIREENQ